MGNTATSARDVDNPLEKNATNVADSIGPITVKGRYRMLVSGADVFYRIATSEAAAEVVTASGSKRGITVWNNNTDELFLSNGDYVGIITASGTASVRLDYLGDY